MKKVVLLLVTVLAFNLSNAQKTYFKEGKFDFATTDSKEVYLTLDTDSRHYGLILKTEKQRHKFISFLTESLSKHSEWVAKAKENNVTDFRKTITEIAFEGYFQYGKWKFGRARLKSIFYVNEEGKCILFIYGGNMKAYTNQYMESKSIIFWLDADTLEVFKNNLSEETIDKFLNNKSNNNSFFI